MVINWYVANVTFTTVFGFYFNAVSPTAGLLTQIRSYSVLEFFSLGQGLTIIMFYLYDNVFSFRTWKKCFKKNSSHRKPCNATA